MENVLIVIVVLAIYALVIYFTLKWFKIQRRKDMIRVVNEMVDDGDLTREQGDAIIWGINYASRKK